MELGKAIKARRTELGISQQELAYRMGYKTRSTIVRLESGENSLPEEKYPKMAQALNTTVRYLKTGAHNHIAHKMSLQKQQNIRNGCLILAGGEKSNNLQGVPNQFISIAGKPAIIYCMETYQNHPSIDDIYAVCLPGWENILDAYAAQYRISKFRQIISAESTGILSAKKGIEAFAEIYNSDDIVILQEATRPLVTEAIISKVLLSCKNSATACRSMQDTIQFMRSNGRIDYLDREAILSLQNPDAYRLDYILKAFKKATSLGHKFTESCCVMLMHNLGYELNLIETESTNIKIVNQEDVIIVSALLQSMM